MNLHGVVGFAALLMGLGISAADTGPAGARAVPEGGRPGIFRKPAGLPAGKGTRPPIVQPDEERKRPLPRSFDALTVEDIRKAKLSGEPIPGDDDNNQLIPGSILFCHTSQGRLSKVLVEKGWPNLSLRWVTYGTDGLVFSSGKGLVVRGTYSCDLDSGAETSKDSDFWWEQVDRSKRRLVPQHGAALLRTEGLAFVPREPLQVAPLSPVVLVTNMVLSPGYNRVQQISCHNSYDKDSIKPPLDQQADAGVRSFEFDLHVSHTTDGVGDFFFGPDDYPHSDWGVYHTTDVDSPGEYCGTLSDGLRKLKAWHDRHPSHEVITVWLELKDPWKTDGHMPVDLNRKRLPEDLPGLIYGPQDLLARAPDAGNLKEAVSRAGWPSVESLRGKFILVLMGNDDYVKSYALDADGPSLCFVAPEEDLRSKASSGSGDVWANAVFYNMDLDHLGDAQFVWEKGYVSRVWNGHWGVGSINDQEDWVRAIASHAHHIATDHVTQDLFTPRLVNQSGEPFRPMQ